MIVEVTISGLLCVVTIAFVIKTAHENDRRFAAGLSVFTLLQQVGYFTGLNASQWPWNPALSSLMAMVQLSVFLQMALARKSSPAGISKKTVVLRSLYWSFFWTGMVWLVLNTIMLHFL